MISSEKLGSYIPSRFLRRLQKMAGFGTTAMVGKAVICQAFIRQMPTSIRARLATQPDSASLESLAVLADCAVASENDVEEAKQGVAEIQISESGKLVGLLEDLSRRLKKLETATATAAKKKNYRHPRSAENRAPKTQFMPNVQAQPFVPSNQNDNRQGFVTNNPQVNRPYASPRRYSQAPFNRPTQSMHRFATITKPSVIRRVCTVNLVLTIN